MVNKAQIRGIIRLKAWITLAVAVLVFILWGSQAGIASVMGGTVAVLGSLIYAKTAYQLPYGPPEVLMKLHFLGEALKMAFTLVAFGAIFVFHRKVVWPALIFGYAAAASAFWFGLLIKFKDKK
ncbi:MULTISPECIES: ATP synthase subunit I [Silvimonas]|uniref:ATP synthase subunit I n=1 Tax=Silvimonas TaxID=300264 RepID=UPI0024B3AD19|nr:MULTISPECIES: ATP synthase subunit I [Silvimonas]MDR3429846.1 ATP synthase subunit I [Silvimonas sp.]